jgi:tetratricopeptide (TPR) repeat protein
VGEVLERRFHARLEEFYPELSHHFYEGREFEKALYYAILAGDAAYRLSASEEAIALYGRALAILAAGQARTDHEQRIYLNLGRSFELTRRFDRAVRTYEDMAAAGRERGDLALVLAAVTAHAAIRITITPVHDPPFGETLAQEALALARELGDRAAEARVLWVLLLLGWVQGWNAELLAYGERSLEIARSLNLAEQIALTLGDLAYAYGRRGRLADMLAALEEARQIWDGQGNLPMQANNRNVITMPLLMMGRFHEALEAGEESIRLSKPIGNLWSQLSGAMLSGLVRLEFGEFGKALELTLEAVRLGESAGLPFQAGLASAIHAWACAHAGVPDRGIALLQGSSNVFDYVTGDIRIWVLAMAAYVSLEAGDSARAWAYLAEAEPDFDPGNFSMAGPSYVLFARARLKLAAGDPDGAIAAAQSLVDLREKSGIRLLVADALLCKAEALLARGDAEAAREALGAARDEAAALDCRRVLWKVHAQLALTDGPDGPDHLRAAAEIVRFILERIEDPVVKDSFKQFAARSGVIIEDR